MDDDDDDDVTMRLCDDVLVIGDNYAGELYGESTTKLWRKL